MPLIKNQVIADLARKVLQELPEELTQQLSSAETKEEKLCLFPAQHARFQGNDIQLITSILRQRFAGDYISEGQGRFHWLISLPSKQPVAPPAAVPVSQTPEAQAAAEPSKPAPAPESAPNDAKPKEAPPKQPSPLKVFQERYCSTCDDQSEGCTPENSTGREKMQRCFNVLQLLFLGDIRENLLKLKPFNRYPPGGRSGSHSQSSQPNSQPQQQKPESFFLENGIVWAKSETGSGKPCDKAYEAKNRKDGALSAEYAK
ncbi:MAG: hypothetical protein PHI29_13265, partial [Gallionella sp.]|nr:hypothetical protein [Gallionella sp.]